MKQKTLAIILFVVAIFLLATVKNLATPVAINASVLSTSRYNDSINQDVIEVEAGNVTELQPISADTQTNVWAGFFGNVSGTIQLADAVGSVFYNWTVLNAVGEIYAANGTVEWNNLQCFNFTASGNYSTGGCADQGRGGETSQCGMNLTQIENLFQILDADKGDVSTDVDGVNETFTDTTHAAFSTSGNQFSQGECLTSYMHDNNSNKTEGIFEEVLMWDPDNNQTIFASLLNDNQRGYDGGTYDFEIMVLENGKGTNRDSTTTYYFYVELS